MIQNRTIVCLASSWDLDPTSKHQIMRILARHNDIVWMNYHGTRRPAATASDFRAAGSALFRFARGLRRVGPSMVQVTPLVIPGAGHPLLRYAHRRLLIAQIRRALRRTAGAGGRPIQVWSFAPDVSFLVGQLGEECFIYYCVDEYSQFDGFDAASLSESENELIDRADVVVTTSELLLRTKAVRRPDVVLMRHGVDYDHFASAWRGALKPPRDLDAVQRPIFGFFGLIHHWIDRPLLANLARLRPQYSFVLIGDCQVDVSALRRIPNVHLLGRRPYQDLPAYCAYFDAGLLPFARSIMTESINPIKMYEYLAAGLPVISTPLPEAARFAGPIRIAETAEAMAVACDEILTTDAPERRAAISRVVENDSWLSKVERLSDIVMRRASARRDAVSATAGDGVLQAEMTANPLATR